MSGTEKIGLDIVPTKNWAAMFWGLNLPLQMWPNENNSWRVINYMPRKEMINDIDQAVSAEELPQFCKNTSAVLRNLADLFDALGERKIDYIYYPDRSLEEAIATKEQDDKYKD